MLCKNIYKSFGKILKASGRYLYKKVLYFLNTSFFVKQGKLFTKCHLIYQLTLTRIFYYVTENNKTRAELTETEYLKNLIVVSYHSSPPSP